MAFTELEVREAEEATEATEVAEEAVDVVANAEDMFRLGLMHSIDMDGRRADFVEAHKWFSLAALMGSLPAKSYREELKHEMSAADLTQAQRAARGWMAENRDILAA